MKRLVVVLISLLLGAGVLTACDTDIRYGAYCVDRTIGLRVDDRLCNSSAIGVYQWYYVPLGSTVPRVGSKASGGSTATPTVGAYRGGLPSSGGKVSSKAPSGASTYTPSKPKSTTKPTTKTTSKPKVNVNKPPKAPSKPK